MRPSVNAYAGWDEYGLKHQAEHLYETELYAEMYDLDRGWLAAQGVFNPSRQVCAESLTGHLRRPKRTELVGPFYWS
jgi:hypothetical protein